MIELAPKFGFSQQFLDKGEYNRWSGPLREPAHHLELLKVLSLTPGTSDNFHSNLIMQIRMQQGG
jgi:hypothetical protein